MLEVWPGGETVTGHLLNSKLLFNSRSHLMDRYSRALLEPHDLFISSKIAVAHAKKACC